MNTTALAPIFSTVVGTSPEELDTPALLNRITSRGARACNQAQKFGAEMAIPDEATSLNNDDGGPFTLNLRIGERVSARSVVLATGARYRRLEVEKLDAFEASSVHYL